MLKACVQLEANSSSYHSCCSAIVSSTSVLLDRLKSGQVPVLCRGKCLAVLMKTVDVDARCATAVPRWMLTAAETILTALSLCHSGDESLVDGNLSFCRHARVTGSQSCGISTPLTADQINAATVVDSSTHVGANNSHQGSSTHANNSHQGGSTHVGANSSHCATSTSSSSNSEGTSVVLTKTVFAAHGLCSSIQTCTSSCSSGSLSEESCDHRTASYDMKLVRKFVLLMLRSLDIVTREPAHQRMPLYYDCNHM